MCFIKQGSFNTTPECCGCENTFLNWNFHIYVIGMKGKLSFLIFYILGQILVSYRTTHSISEYFPKPVCPWILYVTTR